jgi:anti-sigma B factor antagonist
VNSVPQNSPDGTGQTLQVTARRNGDSVTISLAGELDLASSPKLERIIRDAEETEIGAIVVDLAECEFIDSTGLSVLLAAKKRNDSRLTVTPSNHDAVTRLLSLTETTDLLGG